MANLTRIEHLLNNILFEIKYKRSGGNGTSGGRGNTTMPSNGDNDTSSDNGIEKFTNGLNTATSLISSTSGGLKGMLSGISGLTKGLGAYGAALSATIGLIDALGSAIGSFITAMNYAKIQLYEGQAAIFDLKNDQFKQIVTTNINMQTENVKYQGDLQLKMLDTQGQILMNTAKLVTQQFVKSAEISIGSLIEGINESAYKAAEAKIEAEAEMEKTLNINEKLEGVFGRYTKQRELEYSNLKDVTKTEMDLLNTQTAFKVAETGLNYKMFKQENKITGGAGENSFSDEAIENYIKNSQSGKYQLLLTDETKKLPQSILGERIEQDWGDWATRSLGWNGDWSSWKQMNKDGLKMLYQPDLHQAENVNAITKATTQLQQTIGSVGQQIQDKNAEIQTESANLVVDAIKDVKKNWLKLAEANEKWLDNFDKTTNNLGKSLGYTNKLQIDDFQKTMFVAAQAASKFGKTYEDAVKIQQGFIENTGRNRNFSEEDYLNTMRLSEYLGGDTGLAANYVSGMEIFNSGVSDSVDMLGEVLEDVNRIGLNGRKYTKTLVDNLKLAQKYNFKNGTKGLMEMAKWAENTRFNMNSLGGMLDKVSEGGLEGVITQGAQFQVLGGHAAMNADPIAMMFERYADPEAFAKRMQDMTKGYGSLDRTTGETKFSGTEQMLMEQLAKIQGRSVEDVMNEVRARNKKEVVSKQLNSNFNEDQQAFISNNATYDKETGQFKVKVRGNDGKYHGKEVSQITEADLEDIMPADYQGKMLKNMDDIVDALGVLTGKKESAQATVSENTWDVRNEEYKTRGEIADKLFRENMQLYIDKATEYSKKITNSYGDYTTAFEEGAKKAEDFPKNIEGIQKMAKAVEGVLGETASIINSANSQIASAIAVGLEKLKNPKYEDFGKEGKYGFKEVRNSKEIPKTVAQNNEANAQKELQDAYDKGKNAGYFSNFVRGQQMESARAKYFSAVADRQRELGNSGTASWYDFNAVLEQTVGRLAQGVGNLFGGSASGVDDFLHDGIVRGKNAPIVTKVNDSIIESDPKDVAIFAKEGGTIGKLVADLDEKLNSSNGGTIHLDTINVQISGSLDLSSGGQNVNIINELQNNPILLRTLSRMLTEQLSNALNGGRGFLPIGIGNV